MSIIGGYSCDFDDGPFLGSCRNIARASNGDLHVAWNNTNADMGIWYSISTDGGASWAPELIFSSSNTKGMSPAVAVDSNDNVLVLFGTDDGTNKEVHLMTRSSGVWLDEVIDTGYIWWGRWLSIAVDSSDNIYAVWGGGFSGSERSYLIKRVGGSWSSREDLGAYYHPVIVVDYDDNVHIVLDEWSSTLKRYKVMHRVGSQPFTYTGAASGHGYMRPVVCDSSNRLHIAFYDGSQISYVSGTYNNWEPPITTPATTWPSLTIDESGTLYLVYHKDKSISTNYFYIKKPPGESWSAETEMDSCFSAYPGGVEGVIPDGVFAVWPEVNHARPGIPKSGFTFMSTYEDASIRFMECSCATPEWPTECYLKFVSCCNFNGQFLIGGIVATGVDNKYSQWGLNTVAWAQIGRFDFDYGSETSKTAGFMHMPWDGTVLKLTKLGNYVVVYGTNGMAMLRPISEPVSGYGLIPLSMPGIRSGFHCAGDSTLQGFVDVYGYWWTVTQDGKFTRWGYKEFLSQLSDPFKVTFDQTLQRFFISDGSTCYVFNQYGMATVRQQVTSCGPGSDGEVVGICGSNDDYDVRVITDVMDYGTRGLKTITTMEAGIDVDATSAVKLAVDYRYDKRLDFTRSDWNLTNKRGGTGIMKTAVEFRLGVLVEAGFYSVGDAANKSIPEVNLDYILATVQASDRRMIRGAFAQLGGEDASSNNA